MNDWLKNDAVIFDVDAEEILSALVDEGMDINDAINLIEETQHIKIDLN